MTRTILQGTGTLLGVLGLYLAPWMLTVVRYEAPVFEVEYTASVEREAMVWHPFEADTPVDAEPLTLQSAEAIEDATEPSEPTPTATPTAQASATPVAVPSSARPTRKPRLRKRTRIAQAKRPTKRVLKGPAPKTKKQLRRRKRWKHRQERLAEQPQCGDWIDEMLKINSTENTDEWLVGDDLVSCFRAHPQQFMNMGGMSWAEDNGKKTGLRVYVSSKSRGDVARAIGFQRGDVLRSFNGFSLRSVTTVTFALTQLTRNKAKLKYMRKGQKRVFKMRVVDHQELEQARMDQLALADAEPKKRKRSR